MNQFARWLIPIIEHETSLSVSQFGKEAGLARTLISHWMNHPDSQPSSTSVIKVVQFLQKKGVNVSLDTALYHAGIRDTPDVDPQLDEFADVVLKLPPSRQRFLLKVARELKDLMNNREDSGSS